MKETGTLRALVRRHRRHLFGAVAIVGVLGVWEGASYWVAATNRFGSDLLPTIQHVVGTSIPGTAQFGSETVSSSWMGAMRVLADHSEVTVLRLLIGTAIGVALGVGVGVLMSANRAVRLILEPPILVIRNVPLLILIPLFVLWFGTQEKGKYIYVAYAIFVMVVINTAQAIANVKPIYRDYARTLGARPFQVYRTIIFPAMLPELLAGIKVALGVSWAVVLAAEFLAADKGLGKLLILSETFFDVGRMIVIVLVFVLYALILNGIFDAVTARITRWMPQTRRS